MMLASFAGVAAIGVVAAVAAGPHDLPEELQAGGLALALVVATPFVTVGALIISRHPRHPVGWLLYVAGLSGLLADVALLYAFVGLVARPGALPLPELFAWLSEWTWLGLLGSLLLAIQLFPTGRPASRRWALVLWASVLLLAFVWPLWAFGPSTDATGRGLENPVAIEVLRPLREWVDASYWLYLTFTLAAVASVVARYRRSAGVEREQLKWALSAFAFFLGLQITSNALEGVPDVLGLMMFVVGIVAIPVAVAVAILRHRLFDIDLVIRRTLVYGGLTAVLAAFYIAGVLILSQLLGDFAGGDQLAVAASTLAVAAAFQPVRRRVQDVVDRRFYRSRYDAARTVEAFGQRLREELDLDGLTSELHAVIEDTIRPASLSVWLRPR